MLQNFQIFLDNVCHYYILMMVQTYLETAKTYLEPRQISLIEFIPKKVNGEKSLTISAKSSIIDAFIRMYLTMTLRKFYSVLALGLHLY